jgi:hypothetical protein
VNTYLQGCDVLGAELVDNLGPEPDELDTALGELGFPSILGVASPSLGTPQLKLDPTLSSPTPAPASSALPPLVPPPSQATIDAANAAAKQASQAQTAPQAKAATDQMAVAASAPNVPPEVKAQAVQVQKEAAQAVTPAQIEAVKEKLQAVAEAIRSANKPGMATWKIAAIAGGSAVGVGLLVYLLTSMRAARAA